MSARAYKPIAGNARRIHHSNANAPSIPNTWEGNVCGRVSTSPPSSSRQVIVHPHVVLANPDLVVARETEGRLACEQGVRTHHFASPFARTASVGAVSVREGVVTRILDARRESQGSKTNSTNASGAEHLVAAPMWTVRSTHGRRIRQTVTRRRVVLAQGSM
jgi:hypothetical protein